MAFLLYLRMAEFTFPRTLNLKIFRGRMPPDPYWGAAGVGGPISSNPPLLKTWIHASSYEVFRHFTFILVCPTSLAVLSSYSSAIRNNAVMRDEITENYFNIGFTAPEIALFLVSVYGIGISLRQLKSTLRRGPAR